MNLEQLIQVIFGFLGSLGFAILFNVKGKKMIFASLGGLMSWAFFVVLSYLIPSEPVCYLIVSIVISIYAEVCARVLKAPTTIFIIISLIPLIPGGSLYYTVASAFDSSFGVFSEKAIYTLKLAAALALGMIIVLAVWRFFSVRITKNWRN